MKEFIDNIKDKLGFKNYPKLAELLGITKVSIMRLNRGEGSRKLQIAYILFSLCLDEMSEAQRKRLLDEYHAFLYRRMYAEEQDNSLEKYIDSLMKACECADYSELARFLDARESLIVKLCKGQGWRRLRIIYTLLGMSFDLLHFGGVKKTLKNYHSLLYKNCDI